MLALPISLKLGGKAEVRSGDLAVLCINGDEGIVKLAVSRVHFTPEQVQMLPVQIIARVVRVICDDA